MLEALYGILIIIVIFQASNQYEESKKERRQREENRHRELVALQEKLIDIQKDASSK